MAKYSLEIRDIVESLNVDLFDFESSLHFVQQYMREKKGMNIVTINPEMIQLGKVNDLFGRVINEADLVIPDGVGIKLALKIKGINQENIPGIEFAKRLIGICDLEGFSIGLLGAKEEVVQRAAKNLRSEFKNLNITYIRNGYFSEQEENIIEQELKEISPKVVFVALGAPKQELLISKLKINMPETIFIGVGGSFDVWSGMIKRAPLMWQKLGLEWLYRTIKEPSRFKRIFPTLPMFVIRVIIETVHEKLVKKV